MDKDDLLIEAPDFTFMGLKFKTATKSKEPESIVPPDSDDGSFVSIAAGTHQIAYHRDFSGYDNTDISRIKRYREIAQYPECEQAISEIVNEAIISDTDESSVELIIDDTSIPKKLQKTILGEFDHILRLLDFDNDGHDLFRDWYIDGRLVYHVIVNEKQNQIIELRKIDPCNIRKIKEVQESVDPKSGAKIYKVIREYFIYQDKIQSMRGRTQSVINNEIEIHKDAIIFVPSGLLDEERKNVISYLHRSIKTVNQLRMLEDSQIVYRLVRAPERRVFYIDVGNLPTSKAEAYLQSVISKFRNKIVYDGVTGEIKDARQQIAMVEDFWLPRRCLDLQTEILLLGNKTKTLAELIDDYQAGIENYTYSVSPNGGVVPGLISWAGITQENADVIELTLDNGKTITCTPDHKFVLRDGSKKKAEDLRPDDSLSSVSGEEICIVNILDFDSSKVVGTLTIDENHIHHDFHNFALAAGVFVMNSGGSGTDVQTLAGQTNQGAQEDLEYFQKKLFRSLNVPLQRLVQESGFSIGRASEITREEVKFAKLVNRLRRKFASLFIQALRVQLRLRKIITESEWEDTVKPALRVSFLRDNYYAELKETEILRERLSILNDLDQHIGKFFSKEWVRMQILKQSQQDITDMDAQIKKEKEAGEYDDDDYSDENDSGYDGPDSNDSAADDDEPKDDLEKELETDIAPKKDDEEQQEEDADFLWEKR